MTKAVVQIQVADFDTWFAGFTENESLRTSHGATGHTVNRGIDDPNLVVLATDFASAEGVKAFLADPALKEAMARGGVQGAPQAWVCEEVESRRY
jgi:heme-degrading monooxygenase HmoA